MAPTTRTKLLSHEHTLSLTSVVWQNGVVTKVRLTSEACHARSQTCYQGARQGWWASKIQCKATRHLQDQVLQERVSQEITATFFLPLQDFLLVFVCVSSVLKIDNQIVLRSLQQWFLPGNNPLGAFFGPPLEHQQATNNTSNSGHSYSWWHKKRVLARYTAERKKGKLSQPSQDDFFWWMLL